MAVSATIRVDVGLGGSFRAAVLALSPIAYWPLSEPAGSTVAEDLAGSNDGTYVGSPTLGQLGAMPEGGSALGTSSASDYGTATMDLSGYTDSFSVLAVVKINTIAASVIWVAPLAGSGSTLKINSDGTPQGNWQVSGTSFGIPSLTPLVVDRWYVLVLTMNGATDEGKLYVDGVLKRTIGSISGTLQLGSGAMRFGQNLVGTGNFDGDISHVALFNGVLSQTNVDALQTAAGWTPVTADLLAAGGLELTYGIPGSGPEDLVASAGSMTCTLRNDARNAGTQQGWYSPNHASKRSGWTFGIPVRVVFTYSSVEYVKFRGRIYDIDPEAGQYGSQRAHITAYDQVRVLVETDAREVDLQIDETEDILFAELLNALPFAAQPVGSDIDVGLDTIPVAFDTLGGDVPALSAIADVVISTQGRFFLKGDGTLVYRNRQTMASQASQHTFTTMHGLSVPTSLDPVFNHIRVTVYPKTLGASLVVLFSSTGTPQAVPPASTIELWGNYRDPADPSVMIGGFDVVTPVATTDYLANSAIDGSGTNLTSSVTVSKSAFGSAVKLTITNASTQTAYLVNGSGVAFLQVRGKPVYNLSPQTAEATSEQTYGKRSLVLDLPLQDDINVAQGLADYILAQRDTLANQVLALDFLANHSNALMLQALAREPGDRITVTETVTGVTLVDAYIQSVTLTVSAGPIIHCHWTLAPAHVIDMFILDSLSHGVLDLSPLGYA